MARLRLHEWGGDKCLMLWCVLINCSLVDLSNI